MVRLNGDVNNLTLYREVSDVKPSVTQAAYLAPSVVDKTFFKPSLDSLAQIDASLMKPVFDSNPDGTMPDYGVNIAWVRSKARDRVDIDLALSVVKETIDRSKLDDAEKAKALKDSEKQLNKLADIIKSAKDSDSQVSDVGPNASL